MERKILVIDDSKVAQHVIKDDLEDAGFNVLLADSSEDALDIVNSNDKPDLILLDVMMPGMEGDSFCRLMKSRPDTRDIPVILVSTKEESELEELVKQVGADGYMWKARVSAASLARIIENISK